MNASPPGLSGQRLRLDSACFPCRKIRTAARALFGVFWQKESTRLKREEIIAKLRENEAALRARGVAHTALFGSHARGDQRPESDTDIMIEFDPTARITVFDYAGLKRDLAALFDGPVDVVTATA
jgi:predicted nucleotidyltransferase